MRTADYYAEYYITYLSCLVSDITLSDLSLQNLQWTAFAWAGFSGILPITCFSILFIQSLIINHYNWCLSDMLYCVLSSGDVRVMSQQPLSSSSPTLRMPFTLTSHPTSVPASHQPLHRMQHHPTYYPLGSQSSSSEVSVGSVGRPPKPRKQRWVGSKTYMANKIWIFYPQTRRTKNLDLSFIVQIRLILRITASVWHALKIT
jgi:hypothetical protein